MTFFYHRDLMVIAEDNPIERKSFIANQSGETYIQIDKSVIETSLSKLISDALDCILFNSIIPVIDFFNFDKSIKLTFPSPLMSPFTINV